MSQAVNPLYDSNLLLLHQKIGWGWCGVLDRNQGLARHQENTCSSGNASGQLPSLVPAAELALKSQGSTKPAACCSLPVISLPDMSARQDEARTFSAV